MSEQLKACPFCGGDVQFHADDECGGCHYIHCAGCDAFFDFASGADPKNKSATIEALRAVCAVDWNRRANDFDTLAQRLQEAERDANIGAVVWKFIDRMSDHCDEDPASKILDEFVVAVGPAIADALADKGGKA